MSASDKHYTNKNAEEGDDDDEDSDEDYQPEKESESDHDDDELNKSSKRKLENDLDDADECDHNENATKKKNSDADYVDAEEFKKKADAIWSSFLKETKPSTKAVTSSEPIVPSSSVETKLAEPSKASKVTSNRFGLFDSVISKTKLNDEATSNESSSKVQPIPTSATKPKPSGLANILSKIGGKDTKISTLEKSKLDWDEFKKTEKIEDDLLVQTKGKQSFLEKQAFLERTDIRQFELEKEMRDKARKLRDQMK